MKKNLKRAVMLLLALALVLGAFPVTSVSAGIYGTNYSSYTTKVGNVTLPLPEYPNGSCCTTTGNPCSGHNACRRYYVYNGQTVDSLGWQCCGFARYTFWRLFGVVPTDGTGSGYYKAVTNVSSGSINATYLKNLFGSSVKPGAHIRTNVGQDGYNHSLVYAGRDDTYVYTYEGNFDGYCRVTMVQRTWSEMVSYLKYKNGIYYIDMPNNYPVTTPSQYTDPLVFNAAYYKANNPDLASYTDAAAKEHWINHGVAEGRCASPVFNVKWYLDNYSDLKNAMGTDYGKALIHFVDYGVGEGRQGSANFNLNCYKANYSDLRDAFGSNNYSYYKHYVDNQGENRVANRYLLDLPSGAYVFTVKSDSGFSLAMEGDSTAEGARTVIAPATQSDARIFVIEQYNPPLRYYTIRNLASGMYLGMASDGSITQAASSSGDNVKWHLLSNDDGSVTFRSFSNQKCIDISNGTIADQNPVGLWSDNGTAAQKWGYKLLPVLPDGVYSINSAADGSFGLDISNAGVDNSTNLILYQYNGGNHQKFAIYHDDEGYYTIRALHSNKCLDVTNADTAKGANIAQYTDNGTVAQKWSVLPNADGTYTFSSKCNYLAMDVDNGTMENSTNVRCWTHNDSNAQKWVLNPVTTSLLNLEGELVLSSAIDSSYAVTLNGDKTGLAINLKSSTMDEVFTFVDLNNGYYAIFQRSTGKTVKYENGDIRLGTEKTGNNPSDYERGEMWQVMPNGDGTVGILSAVNGYYWNAWGGVAEANARVAAFHRNTDAASRWNLEISSHVHTFTDEVFAPTCTDRGYTVHTCTECSGTVTDSYVEPLGHDFVSIGVQPATCQHGEATTYRCKREGCGFEKYEYAESEWSDWSDAEPTDIPASMVETRTVYRYADYETTTSNAASLEGYEQLSSQWQRKSSGHQDRASFPAGYNTSNSLYSQYNKSALTAFENSTKRTIDSTSTVGYIYWHWCHGATIEDSDTLMNRYIEPSSGNGYNTFHAYFSTTAPGTSYDTDTAYPWCNAKNRSVCCDSYWFYYLPVTRQNYTDYEKLYTYGRYGAWSDWSETPVTATETRKVESRTEYRYVANSQLAPHAYETVAAKEPTCTEKGFTASEVCSVCGDIKTPAQEVEALGHDMQTRTEGASCVAPSAIYHYCTRCDYDFREFAELEWTDWSDTKPDAADSMIKTRTVYRYADYETTTSTATSLEGYEQLSSQWQKKSSGYQDRVSFPAGYNTSNSLYGQYNKSALTAFENSTKRTIDSTSTVGYIYWHWCRGATIEDSDTLMNRYMEPSSGNGYDTFHAYFSTTAPGTSYDTDTAYPWCNAKNRSVCCDTFWFYYLPVTRQNYTDYEKLYTYGRFGAWSDWSETEVTASETRRVETKTQYAQVAAGSYGDHQFAVDNAVEATCTEPGYTGDSVCRLCGAVEAYGEVIPTTEHAPERVGVREATCTENGYTGDLVCANCHTTLEEGSSVEALGHSFKEADSGEYYQAPTCEENGFAFQICQTCGAVGSARDLPSTGHQIAIDSSVPATCTTDGKTAGTHCSTCGKILAPQNTIPATGHTEGAPVDNGDGTHSVYCTVCKGLVKTEDHAYTDGSCVCGAKEPVTAPVYDANLKFRYSSFTMGSTLNMVYIVGAGSTNYADVRAVVTKYNADGTTTEKTYSISEGTVKDSGTFSTFTFDGIAAKELGDNFVARLYATGKDGTEYYGEEKTLNLKDLLLPYTQGADSTKKDLAVALLNYGAAAQVYFGYNYDEADPTTLVNNAMTDEQKVIDIREATATTAVTGSGAKNVYNTVLLESKIVLYAIFNLSDYSSRIGELTAVVTNAETGEVVTTLPVTAMGVNGSFRFDDVSAKNTRTVFSIAIYDGETKVSQDLQWSIECMVSGCRANTSTSQAKLNLANAILAYGDYAAAYLG